MEIESKSALGAPLTFERCLFDQVNANHQRCLAAVHRGRDGWTDTSGNGIVTVRAGGVNFVDCVVNDSANRPFLTFPGGATGFGVRDITDTITVHNPSGATLAPGAITANRTLAATAVTSRAPRVKSDHHLASHPTDSRLAGNDDRKCRVDSKQQSIFAHHHIG